MKKIVFSILIITALISCEKIGDLKFSNSVPGGCANEKGNSLNNDKSSDVDKVTYSIVNGNLDIFVGFNATCCGQYSSTSEIKGDSILIRIVTMRVGDCNCICYYTYDFNFIGGGENYKYKVTVPGQTFSGKIKS